MVYARIYYGSGATTGGEFSMLYRIPAKWTLQKAYDLCCDLGVIGIRASLEIV